MWSTRNINARGSMHFEQKEKKKVKVSLFDSQSVRKKKGGRQGDRQKNFDSEFMALVDN